MSLGRMIQDALLDGSGLSKKEAERLAVHIIEAGARQGRAGSVCYWPKNYRPTPKEERAEAIAREYNGRNLKEICEKYQVSSVTVYRDLHKLRGTAAGK